MTTPRALLAGAAQTDITPHKPSFLHGYPHRQRISTATHDPLMCSGLYLKNPQAAILMLANDLLFVPRRVAVSARHRIAQAVGLPADNVLITSTHTHSGPVTVESVIHGYDLASPVPPPDAGYLQQLEDALVQTAQKAAADARPASLRTALADGSALGTNRRDPAGPSIPEMPVLQVLDDADGSTLALMVVCSMHPMVLHEDSTQYSGDFPGLARRHLQRSLLASDKPLIYHMGASGNQSPRHITRANTYAEADRLGGILADAITLALARAQPIEPTLWVVNKEIELPLRALPSLFQVTDLEAKARARLEELRNESAPRATLRTAEVDWFGAERTLHLAQAAESGNLQTAAAEHLPARVTVIRLGTLTLVCWPGEVFAEFALQVKSKHSDAHIITLSDGGLLGYLVTQEAIDQGAYEAGNAVFASPASGQRLVNASLELLDATEKHAD